MKVVVWIALFVYCSGYCYSQKPPIDSSIYDNWPSVEGATISNNGKFCQYVIQNQPVHSSTLILQGTSMPWKMVIPGIPPYQTFFTDDSRMAVFFNTNDSLGLVTLDRASVEYIPQVSSFKIQKGGTGEWLAYQADSPTKRIILRDLVSGKTRSFDSVTNYLFSEEGTALLLQTETYEDSKGIQSILWIRIRDENIDTIWRGSGAGDFVFDPNKPRMAFLAGGSSGTHSERSLWYFEEGAKKAIKLADNHSSGIDTGMCIGGIQGFSINGKDLYFNIKKSERPKASPEAVQVDVWSWADSKLQAQQLKERDIDANYLALIRLQDDRVIRLEYQNEHADNSMGEYALIDRSNGDAFAGEANWNPATRHSICLESTVDGKRKCLKENISRFCFYSLSPGGKYVIYYDPQKKCYYSYLTGTGITVNITQKISTVWTLFDDDHPYSSYATDALSGWLKNDEAVLLRDQNDVWQVDPKGKKPPINLTNGYGRAHKIVFRLAMYDQGAVLDPDRPIILNAFNRQTKENGFYSKLPGKMGDPELLTMGPFLYDIPGDPGIPDGVNFTPIKAGEANAYIVRRMSATESPNYYFTSDFRRFMALSDLHPEKSWNWYVSELHAWKTPDGRENQGILYKPENFDSKKKYPVIFYYYEKKSDGLNAYLNPEPSYGWLNITWFVSNGYLVFTPDIHFTIGKTGKSTLDAVLSAAAYLSRFSWVDTKKMGIQGMSFGGFETNYLVTHTHLFAAACSSSGISDFISGYGSLYDNGAGIEDMYELSFYRIGHTLWQRPDLYVENSAIFRADHVTTPFLMMHTKNDGVCPFSNAVEFFTALRRLGKKVWMLQYDDGNHGLQGKSAADFSIRMAQFFDHYLRGFPPPKWMTEGIPAKMKGIESGLELDLSGRQP